MVPRSLCPISPKGSSHLMRLNLLPSCSYPVQWIGDTLFGMDALTHGAAEWVGPDLLHTVALISGVVRLHMGDLTAFDMHPQCAAAAAVDVAGIPKDTHFPVSDGGRYGGASRIEDFDRKRKERRGEDDAPPLIPSHRLNSACVVQWGFRMGPPQKKDSVPGTFGWIRGTGRLAAYRTRKAERR